MVSRLMRSQVGFTQELCLTPSCCHAQKRAHASPPQHRSCLSLSPAQNHNPGPHRELRCDRVRTEQTVTGTTVPPAAMFSPTHSDLQQDFSKNEEGVIKGQEGLHHPVVVLVNSQ